MSVFSETQNLLDFFNANSFSKVALMDNAEKGTKFISFDSGKLTARVANNVEELSWDLSISMFTPEDGDPSLMVHLTGESSATERSVLTAPVKETATLGDM